MLSKGHCLRVGVPHWRPEGITKGHTARREWRPDRPRVPGLSGRLWGCGRRTAPVAGGTTPIRVAACCVSFEWHTRDAVQRAVVLVAGLTLASRVWHLRGSAAE